MLRGLPDERIVTADVVGVRPVYDSPDITSLAGATIACQEMTLLAVAASRGLPALLPRTLVRGEAQGHAPFTSTGGPRGQGPRGAAR